MSNGIAITLISLLAILILVSYSFQAYGMFDNLGSLGLNNVVMLVAQSYPTLYDPMDCRPPGSSVHRILQARILQWVAMPFSRGSSWVAMPFSRGSSQPRD